MVAVLALVACSQRPNVDERTIDGPGDARVFVRSVGPAHPERTLLAVHGGPGLTSDPMRALERLADGTTRVVTYDQHGSGRSSGTDFALHAYVAELGAVRDATAEGEVVLVAHSWGALVAVAYATPDRVAKLVVVGPAELDPSTRTIATEATRARIDALSTTGAMPAPPADLPATCAHYWPAFVASYADPARIQPSHLPSSCNRDVNRATWEALGDRSFVREGLAIGVPTLVVYGDADPLAASAAEWGDAQVVVLPDCGHHPMNECPEAFDTALGAFLTDQRSPRPKTSP